MKVSQKTEYALRAMLELARQADRLQPVRSAEIAKKQHIPEKFLELILVELRRGGLVASVRGPIGGHRLARSAERISVGDIWRAIEGAQNDGGRLRNGEAGEKNSGDPFAPVWAHVDRAVAEVVDAVTLEEIRARSESRQSVPDFNI